MVPYYRIWSVEPDEEGKSIAASIASAVAPYLVLPAGYATAVR
jgi:hypothetical protein